MSGESGFQPLTEQAETIKRESDLQSENVSAPERKDTECCDAVVRQYGDAFWVCCSKCTHKLGKIINVDEFMSQSAFEFQVKCTSCKPPNIVNAKTPVEVLAFNAPQEDPV